MPDGLSPSLHAEVTTLGACLLDPVALRTALDSITPAHFALDSHSRIFRVMGELTAAGSSVDYVTVLMALQRNKGELDAIGGPEYLASLSEGVPRKAQVRDYIAAIKDHYVERQLLKVFDAGALEVSDGSKDVKTVIAAVSEQLHALQSEDVKYELRHVKDVFADYGNVDEMHEAMATTQGIGTGIAEFDKITMGYQPKCLIILAARPKMGKALRCDEPILTPSGWVRNDSLHVGDALASIDGQDSFVDGIFPQGIRAMFRVQFSDGRAIDADAEHLWSVHYRGWSASRVITTSKLQAMLSKNRYQRRLWVDTFTGDFGHTKELPLHPYALGALIGDGNFGTTTPRFSSVDAEILERLAESLPEGMKIVHSDRCNYRIIDPITKKGNRVSNAIMKLGLRKVRSEKKFIPKIYLEASRRQRVELLCGLMDTDGGVEKNGSIVYSTSSPQLAEDVQYLARSLGATSSIYTRMNPTYTHKGLKLQGMPSFRVGISHRDAAQFVHLSRKKIRVQRILKSPRLTISSITPAAPSACQCIAVSHPSKLYIASRGFVVTHNTAKMINDAYHAAVIERKKVALFTLEQDKLDVLRRMLSSVTQVPYEAIKARRLSREQKYALIEAQAQIMESDLYITDIPNLTATRIWSMCRWMKENIGFDIGFIDQLSRLSPKDVQTRGMQKREIIGEQTNIFKMASQQLEAPIVLLCQLRRHEGKGDARPSLEALKDSGDIEEDADLVEFLHRPAYYDRGSTESDEIIVAANREGDTGVCQVEFNGSIMRWQDRQGHHEPQQQGFDSYYRDN